MTLRKTLLIQSILLIGSILFSIWVGGSLPDVVPVHWGLSGKPDRFGSKYELLLMGPILSLVGIGLTLLMRQLGKKQDRNAVEAMYLASVATSFLFAYIHIIIAQSARGLMVNMVQWITIGVCALFVVLGNVMTKLKPNPYVGIRLPWTMNNEKVWREAHRRAGYFWVYGGLGMIVLILLGLPPVGIVVLFMAFSFGPILDSWLIAKRINRVG